MSNGTTVAGEANASIVFKNELCSANNESTIYKTMTETSNEVETGDEITFQVEIYTGTDWIPAANVCYIPMDDNGATDVLQVTGMDGLITLTKTENGYPSIRFVDVEVLANVYSDMSEGDYRVVEVSADDSWGILSGYDSDDYTGVPAISIQNADTFVNANDSGQQIEIEKASEIADEGETFTFQVTHILSSSELPLTDSSQI